VDILRAMGARIEIHDARDVCGEPVGDLLIRSSPLRGITVDAELIVRAIDELPLLAVVMAFAHGRSVIRGAEELRVKESDRIRALAVALAALGVTVEERRDGLVIAGQGRLRGGTVHSQGDHRVAMALSVAGLGSDEGVIVREPECIAISFPDYYRLVQEVTGVRLETG
jgi:3-phosphoshikimate 1-carboxyvinyltransferase